MKTQSDANRLAALQGMDGRFIRAELSRQEAIRVTNASAPVHHESAVVRPVRSPSQQRQDTIEILERALAILEE